MEQNYVTVTLCTINVKFSSWRGACAPCAALRCGVNARRDSFVTDSCGLSSVSLCSSTSALDLSHSRKWLYSALSTMSSESRGAVGSSRHTSRRYDDSVCQRLTRNHGSRVWYCHVASVGFCRCNTHQRRDASEPLFRCSAVQRFCLSRENTTNLRYAYDEQRQISAVANWPGRQNRAVDRSCRSVR